MEFLQINERIHMLFVPRKTVIKAEYSIKAFTPRFEKWNV